MNILVNISAGQIAELPLIMTKTGGLRDVMADPTQNLLDSLNSNSFSRIRSALQVPRLDFNYRDPERESQTLLMRICRLDLTPRSRCDLMKIVLDKPGNKVDVNSVDEKGMSALAHACKTGDDQLVRLFSEDADVDPNLTDNDGNTPLMHACCHGKTNVVMALMTCFGPTEIKVDLSNNEGITPLMEAARRGYRDICRLLVDQGRADVSLRSKVDNFTAKDYALESGRCSTPELLLLDAVAQRKIRARRARKAMGRSILNDFCPDLKMLRPSSAILTPSDNRAKQLRNLPLSREYIDQMNSIVFQVGKHLERLPEDLDGEAREVLDDNEIHVVEKHATGRRMSVHVGSADKIVSELKVRRRSSLPSSYRSTQLSKVTEDASQETSTSRTKKNKPVRLPQVPRTAKGAPQNLSTSPTSPSAPTSPRYFSKTSPRRAGKDNSQQTQAQVIRASSSKAHTGVERTTGNWVGKSSTSVPSYLFR